MAQPGHDYSIFHDLVIFLTAAAVVVPFVQRLRLSPVLGFLLAGALLGPFGLGGWVTTFPWLEWVTVSKGEGLGEFGELGVVFLLFVVGLELPLQRLITMRRLVFGLGGLQIALSAIAIALVARYFGSDAAAATIIGFSLALSSTAIVVEILSQQNRLTTASGRASFSVLLAQDLAVVPLLFLVTILGTQGEGGSIVSGLLTAFAQAGLAILVIVGVGTVVLRPLFRLVASSDSVEIFVAATLLVAVGSGLATAQAGMSMALGAFIAGLLLAETEFRRAIETHIEPFKGLLLGLFFFTVGMSLDIPAVAAAPLLVLGAVVGLVALKTLIIVPLIRLFKFNQASAVESASLLGSAGEFAFIVIGLAMATKVVPMSDGEFVIVVASLSMMLIPFFDIGGRWLSAKLQGDKVTALDPALADLPEDGSSRAIIIGYGRVGQLVADMLERHAVSHVVTEKAPNLVSDARSSGKPVYYGDGKSTQFLVRCGLMQAQAVIITMHVWSEVDELVRAVRSIRPDVVIVARARDADHARKLYELGVTDAVPETIEASLQLSEAALVGLGTPIGLVIASVHEKRDEFRAALTGALNAEDSRESRGVRGKTQPSAGE